VNFFEKKTGADSKNTGFLQQLMPKSGSAACFSVDRRRTVLYNRSAYDSEKFRKGLRMI